MINIINLLKARTKKKRDILAKVEVAKSKISKTKETKLNRKLYHKFFLTLEVKK